MGSRKSEKVSEEAKQTLVFVNQVEAMIASGPHGKLDEYVSVVDLLFNAVTLFEKSGYEEGLVQVRSLLQQAMDDLEFEFQDMLQRRSTQAKTKISREQLEMRRSESRSSNFDPIFSDYSFTDRNSDDGSSTGEVSLELLPPASARWLNEIALRMKKGHVAAKCAETYKNARVEFIKYSLQTLKTDFILKLSLENTTWESLEKTCREWNTAANLVIGVLFKAEYELCVKVLDGLLIDQTRAFHDILAEGFEETLKGIFRVGRDIASKRFPEQLFAMLDVFDTVDSLIPRTRRIFAEVGREDLKIELISLPTLLAEAVMASFDQMGAMIKDVPSPSSEPQKRNKLGLFRSTEKVVEQNYDLIPKGATVHPITSYVVNFVRGYLHRLGSRNYASILEKVFADHGNRPGFAVRSVDRETGLLVMALWQSLEARSSLYNEPTMKHLFLLNNVNYLYRSMLLWHSWHGIGLQRAIDIGRLEENEELVRVLLDLQDDNVVGRYITKFQRSALGKIFAILGEPSPEVTAMRGLAKITESLTEVKSKLKKFGVAFDELCQQQLEWIIPDDELRVRIRGQWVNIIKERHRRLLLPYWEELAHAKFIKPEDIEARVVTFFQNTPEH